MFCASDGPPAPQLGVTVDCASVSHPALLCTYSVYVTTGAGFPDRNTPVLSSHSSACVLTVVSNVAVLFAAFGSGVADDTVTELMRWVPFGTDGATSTVIKTVLDV